MASSSSSTTQPASALQLNIFSLNCWGLKFVSKHRRERLTEIAQRLASASPTWDIVALQEFWVYDDYLALRSITSGVLPYGKFYHSGVLGGGLVVLSRYPIVSSTMHRYTLNGRPTAFWRGDWYVGKGVACATIEVGGGGVVEVFNTHLHAPYEAGDDSYLCHRTAQAWEISKLMRAAVQKGHIPIGLGDFNMIPSSLAHHIITTHGLVSDAWLSKYPNTPTADSTNLHASYNIDVLGVTCDSVLNTWRMPDHCLDIPSGDYPKDTRAKRLDYIFHSKRVSKVIDIKVGATDPMKLRNSYKIGDGVAKGGIVSLSDHFSVELKLEIPPRREPPLISLGGEPEQEAQEGHEEEYLSLETIDEIQALSKKYTMREQWEYKWRIAHFWLSVLVLILIHVAVWWGAAYHAGVAFLLLFLGWVIVVTGTVNGLIGFLFMGSELNALKEFDSEIEFYRRIAEKKLGSGEGVPKTPVKGAVVGDLTTEERIEEELGLEERSVEVGRVLHA